ncbi:MAG: hypothetical protein ACTSUE_01210 [Promethearchaeota archaeon]
MDYWFFKRVQMITRARRSPPCGGGLFTGNSMAIGSEPPERGWKGVEAFK